LNRPKRQVTKGEKFDLYEDDYFDQDVKESLFEKNLSNPARPRVGSETLDLKGIKGGKLPRMLSS